MVQLITCTNFGPPAPFYLRATRLHNKAHKPIPVLYVKKLYGGPGAGGLIDHWSALPEPFERPCWEASVPSLYRAMCNATVHNCIDSPCVCVVVSPDSFPTPTYH